MNRVSKADRLVLGLLPIALCAGTVGFASEEDADADLQPIDVVTIIGRKADATEIAGSAHIIDAESLAIFNDSDILRVLRAVPGVYVQEEEGYGLRPNIGIRGSGMDRSARIALLEDGVLIAPAPYAASSAYYFPTQRRMDTVEVLKGPSAVTVGPRTIGGAVNLISTPIPTDFSANVDVRIGGNNVNDAHINVGDRSERIGWLLETVQMSSDGYKTIDAPNAGDTGFDIEDYVGKLQIDSDPASTVYQSLRFKIGHTTQDADETYVGLTDADFADDPYRRYAASANDNFVSEHEQYQATYVFVPDSNWRGDVTVYRNNFERNWYKLQSVAGESLVDVLTDPVTYATEFSYLTGTTSPDDALQIRANNRSYYSEGVQGRLEWDLAVADTDVLINAGFRLHEDEEDRFQNQDGYRMQDGVLELTTAAAPGSQSNRVSTADVRAFFVDADIRSGRWVVTPGLRHEHIELERLDFSTADPTRAAGPTRVRDNSLSVLIPGVGTLYQLTNSWQLLAGVHRGYNPPSPGSSADEETSNNFEFGTRFNTASLNFEAIYFINDYDNLVGTVTASTGGSGQIGDQFDGGEAIVQGLEVSFGSRPHLKNVEFPLELFYTFTAEAEFENGFESNFDPWGDIEAGDELPYIPEHQLRATAGVETGTLRAHVAINYVGKRRTIAGEGAFDPGTTIDSSVVWDLSGAWEITSQLSLYVKVDNLFDETYIAARRPAGVRPGLPRTAYLGFQYSL